MQTNSFSSDITLDERAAEKILVDLSALVAGRLCHDLASPLGALSNGLEILNDEELADMKEHAFELVQKSADQACTKLRFARLAFGLRGMQKIPLSEIILVANAFAAHNVCGTSAITWENDQGMMLPKIYARLLLNLIFVALHSFSQEGALFVRIIEHYPPHLTFRVAVSGKNIGVPPKIQDILLSGLQTPDHANQNGQEDALSLDTHSVQSVLTYFLAKQCHQKIDIAMENRLLYIRTV